MSKMLDLNVDYIDSRSITQQELSELSAFIRRQKRRNAAKTLFSIKEIAVRKKKKLELA